MNAQVKYNWILGFACGMVFSSVFGAFMFITSESLWFVDFLMYLLIAAVLVFLSSPLFKNKKEKYEQSLKKKEEDARSR